MYKYDIYQVYRAIKDYDCHGNIIKENTLLQIANYRGSIVGLKSEYGKTYFLNADELLNEEKFKRIF